MLPNTDETTVDTVTLAPSKQSIETTEVKSTTQSEPGKLPVEVEEIHTEEASAGKVQVKRHVTEQTEDPNPLLLDPYEFDHCAITIVYSRVGDRQASISVHNHKDDPLVKTFPLVEVPLPEQIAFVIEQLLEIWPDSKVSATMVLLPREDESERKMVVSIRSGNDTPIVLTGVASEFPLPPSITTLLDELKELLPATRHAEDRKRGEGKIQNQCEDNHRKGDVFHAQQVQPYRGRWEDSDDALLGQSSLSKSFT